MSEVDQNIEDSKLLVCNPNPVGGGRARVITFTLLLSHSDGRIVLSQINSERIQRMN